MQIVVDERNRLLHVDLSGFKSTVNLSHDYPVFQYAAGVKPSKAVSLGCLWALPVGNWAKQATWNANGTIMVVGGLSNGDRCMHTPRTLPIPDGVTFSWRAPYGNPSAEYRGLAAPPLIARRVEAEPDSGGGHVP